MLWMSKSHLTFRGLIWQWTNESVYPKCQQPYIHTCTIWKKLSPATKTPKQLLSQIKDYSLHDKTKSFSINRQVLPAMAMPGPWPWLGLCLHSDESSDIKWHSLRMGPRSYIRLAYFFLIKCLHYDMSLCQKKVKKKKKTLWHCEYRTLPGWVSLQIWAAPVASTEVRSMACKPHF